MKFCSSLSGNTSGLLTLNFFPPLSADSAASFRLALTARSWSLAFFFAALAKMVATLDLASFPLTISRLAFSFAIFQSRAWTIREVFQLSGRLVSSGGSRINIFDAGAGKEDWKLFVAPSTYT